MSHCAGTQGQAAWPPRPRPGAQPSRAHLRPGLRLPGLRPGWSCSCFSGVLGPLRCTAPRVSTDGTSMAFSARRPPGPRDNLVPKANRRPGPAPAAALSQWRVRNAVGGSFRLGSDRALQTGCVEPELNNRRGGPLWAESGKKASEPTVFGEPQNSYLCDLEFPAKLSSQ